MLRAAIEVELYRGRYKHSNKNDDDLPIVSRTEKPVRRTRQTLKQSSAGSHAQPVIVASAIFGLAVAGIIALRVATWLPALHH